MNTKNNFVIRPPVLALRVGIVGSVFFGVFFLLMPFVFPDQMDTLWLAYLIMSPFFFLSIFLIAFYKRWKVSVRGNEICCQFLFGRKLLEVYDIDGVKIRSKLNVPEKLILYSKEKRLFSVEDNYESYHMLKNHLEEKNITFYS